jgi:hypothetical protein
MKTFIYSVSVEAETTEDADAILSPLIGQECDVALDFVLDNEEEVA